MYIGPFCSLCSVVVQQRPERYLTCSRYFRMQINLQWIVSDLCSTYTHLAFNQIKFNRSFNLVLVGVSSFLLKKINK